MLNFEEQTPMMQQYLTIKKDYPNTFLFYRLGDFYELFFDDAIQAAQILEITLTSRNKSSDNPIPMAGVPHHSAQSYIDRLIELGHKVAICEQVEDPKEVKGMVNREVVQVVTPGTVVSGENLEANQNNYLVAVVEKTEGIGFTYIDLSTGELKTTKLASYSALINEIAALEAKEVIFEAGQSVQIQAALQERFQLVISSPKSEDINENLEGLLESLDDETLYQVNHLLLRYIDETQMRSLEHLQPITYYETTDYLKYGIEVRRNLELTSSLRDGSRHGTLLWLLDETKTAMGGRMLKRWLDRPLINVEHIQMRQSYVGSLMDHFFDRADLSESLSQVYDLERLVGRISYGTVNARDLNQLGQSLSVIPEIKMILQRMDDPDTWQVLIDDIDPVSEVRDLIDHAILEDVPISITEGNIIKDGYHEQLDEYREALTNGKKWLIDLETTERKKTGIKNLKVGYNKVFGYFIEITKSNLDKIEEGQYERKQTLANAERFITPELKEVEAKILEAEEKSQMLEYELFIEVRQMIKNYIQRLQALANVIASIDVLQSFATISEENHYICPEFQLESQDIVIEAGRHPVVEQVMDRQSYVPNDVLMQDGTDILLITGPNMSGKSTYMRQLALIVIMAQMGCFIPAKVAKLPIFDQIFARIGATDDLIGGQSTFMVEMTETNDALQHASSRSLLLFDEIGRGTATYDGMALAEAIIEYVHHQIGAKTLFSTHYHELTDLEGRLSGLQNVHVGAVEEENGTLTFLHKISPGSADRSYGVQVARLAGLPKNLLVRAQEILNELENKNHLEGRQTSDEQDKSYAQDNTVIEEQLTLFGSEYTESEIEVLEELKALDILYLSPMAAFEKIKELKDKLE